jgi:DNA polymerase-1
MSSTPNFQNMAKNWYDKPDGYRHPDFLQLPVPSGQAVPELPLLRKYILPEDGHVLVAADYSGQEVRVAAHFEDGSLMAAYNDNPKLDPHAFVRDAIKELTGRAYERRVCKVALFSTLYGAGALKLAEQLGCSQAEAAQIRQALFMALPGIREVDNELKQRARCGEPFRTAGGREYYCEPAKVVDGRYMSFEYKCLNTVVQGSSADMTKAAMLRYDSCKQHGNLLLQVHDELVLSVPVEHARTEAAILTNAMQDAMRLDVPVLAEAKMGYNFASMKEM